MNNDFSYVKIENAFIPFIKMIFNDTILVLFPLVPMLFLLIIMVLYHKSHSKYLSENVQYLYITDIIVSSKQ